MLRKFCENKIPNKHLRSKANSFVFMQTSNLKVYKSAHPASARPHSHLHAPSKYDATYTHTQPNHATDTSVRASQSSSSNNTHSLARSLSHISNYNMSNRH